MSKTYKSSLFKRIIDLGLVREAEVDDLVRIWRVGTGDEKAITLQNFVATVDRDLGEGGLSLTELIEALEIRVAELEAESHPAVTLATPPNGLTLVGQELGIGLSSASTIGALSNTDWSTFNGKIGGSGTINYVPKFTGTGTIGDSRLIDTGLVAYFSNQTTNTFFGNGAGQSHNLLSSRNTAFGHSAGILNVSGINWIAIGQGAGFGATGSSWVAIGQDAGKNCTTSEWLAIGQDAAEASTTGTQFIAIGRAAAQSNTTGSNWTAIGFASALYNTTLSNWTAIGHNSGRRKSDGSEGATFSNGTYIGADTRVGAINATNEIVIGYIAEGRGSNTTTIGNTSTTSSYLFGTLRIGTISNLGTTPTEVLVPSATGVVSKRTLAELGADLGAVLTTGDQTIAGIKTFTTQVSVTGSFLSLSPLPDNRSKIRLFGTSFEWGIGTQSASTFGRLNDTAVTFNVPNTDARGWLWGDSGHTLPSQGSMSLTSNGNLTVANSLRLGYGESDTEDVVAYGFDHNGTVRIKLDGVSASTIGFTIVDSSDVEVFNIRGGGRVKHATSSAGDESTTRNELPTAYTQTVTTVGVVNDLALLSFTKRIVLGASVTELTGVEFSVDRLLYITANTNSKIIRNESVSSSTSNRFSIGSDLTIPANETYSFIYYNARWRRVL